MKLRGVCERKEGSEKRREEEEEDVVGWRSLGIIKERENARGAAGRTSRLCMAITRIIGIIDSAGWGEV